MSAPHDSFTQLRIHTRWRIAVFLCGFGLVTLALLGLLNAQSGRTDSVWLSVFVFSALACALVALLRLPKDLGGKTYFWISVVIIAALPAFGYIQGRTFHYWAYVLPPVLFFVLRPGPALLWMIVFGAYAAAAIVPFTPAIDVYRFGLSYSLLVGFMYTYALLEERAAAMLQHMSRHDALTNCLNRGTFNEALTAMEKRDRCAFLLIDIDKFKAINDSRGHLIGDRVITAVAAALSIPLRSDTPLYRYGGEEFAVILDDADMQDATTLAERLRHAVCDAEIAGMPVTVSIGVSAWRPDQGSLNAALEDADKALYAAKRGGRNRVEPARPAAAGAGQPPESHGDLGPAAGFVAQP